MAANNKIFSNKQEKMVAKELGGYQIGGSGAVPCAPGDVKTYEWLVECKTKTSESKSFSIKKEWLEKNAEEAFAMNKQYNALVFDFGDNGNRYYVIDEKTFLKLKEAEEKQ